MVRGCGCDVFRGLILNPAFWGPHSKTKGPSLVVERVFCAHFNILLHFSHMLDATQLVRGGGDDNIPCTCAILV